MALLDFRSVYLPYCLKRLPDGRYTVLNREYRPLGITTTDFSCVVDYEKFPIAARLKLTPKMVARCLSHSGSPDVERIYLYDSTCVPTEGAKHMNAYMKRLKILAHLDIIDNRMVRNRYRRPKKQPKNPAA